MTHPMYFWYITVGAVLLVFFVNFVRYMFSHHSTHNHHHHIIGLLHDRDIFYVPGDKSEEDEFDE